VEQLQKKTSSSHFLGEKLEEKNGNSLRSASNLNCADNLEKKKYFDYSVFNIVDCGLPRSGSRRHALAKTIGKARGLDINSPQSAENHPQDLQFCRH
jgi:hypothetical protein